MCCEINIGAHGFVLGIHPINSLLGIYPLGHGLRTDKGTKSILALLAGSLSSVCSSQYPQSRGPAELFILTVSFPPNKYLFSFIPGSCGLPSSLHGFHQHMSDETEKASVLWSF